MAKEPDEIIPKFSTKRFSVGGVPPSHPTYFGDGGGFIPADQPSEQEGVATEDGVSEPYDLEQVNEAHDETGQNEHGIVEELLGGDHHREIDLTSDPIPSLVSDLEYVPLDNDNLVVVPEHGIPPFEESADHEHEDLAPDSSRYKPGAEQHTHTLGGIGSETVGHRVRDIHDPQVNPNDLSFHQQERLAQEKALAEEAREKEEAAAERELDIAGFDADKNDDGIIDSKQDTDRDGITDNLDTSPEGNTTDGDEQSTEGGNDGPGGQEADNGGWGGSEGGSEGGED
jgi:hypothetical protein